MPRNKSSVTVTTVVGGIGGERKGDERRKEEGVIVALDPLPRVGAFLLTCRTQRDRDLLSDSSRANLCNFFHRFRRLFVANWLSSQIPVDFVLNRGEDIVIKITKL